MFYRRVSGHLRITYIRIYQHAVRDGQAKPFAVESISSILTHCLFTAAARSVAMAMGPEMFETAVREKLEPMNVDK